jgi:hypothetical protein
VTYPVVWHGLALSDTSIVFSMSCGSMYSDILRIPKPR